MTLSDRGCGLLGASGPFPGVWPGGVGVGSCPTANGESADLSNVPRRDPMSRTFAFAFVFGTKVMARWVTGGTPPWGRALGQKTHFGTPAP